MGIFTSEPFKLNEDCTATFTMYITDDNGNALPGTSLQSLTCWNYVQNSPTEFVNERDGQDILGPSKTGQNNFEIDGNGLITWYIQRADTEIRLQTSTSEVHILLLQWTWDPGDGRGIRACNREIEFHIANVEQLIA